MKKWQVMVHVESVSANDSLDEHFKLIHKKRLFIFFRRNTARKYIRAILNIARHYKKTNQEEKIEALVHETFLKKFSGPAISRLFNAAPKIDPYYELGPVYLKLLELQPNDPKLQISYNDLLINFSDSARAAEKLTEYLLNNPDESIAWQKFISLDKSNAAEISFKLYSRLKDKMPLHLTLLVTAMLSVKNSGIYINWNALPRQLHKYNFKELEHFLAAAFVHLDTINFKLIKEFFTKKIHKTKLRKLKESDVLILANYLYKAADKEGLVTLLNSYKTKNSRLAMYKAFAENNPGKGLLYRGIWLKEAFEKFYLASEKKIDKAILYPEKDLCGDVFSSFYFKEAIASLPPFSVFCDERLFSLYQRNYPEINFISKSPPKIRNNISNFSSNIPAGLSRFIDQHAYEQSQGAQFFNFDIERYINSAPCQGNLESGWLQADEVLVKKWKSFLHAFDAQYFVGLAASSTHSTPERDVYTISFDHWQPIFDLKNIVFINVNPAMSSSDCRTVEEKFNISFISPDLDLFNDFENLLALMSCLDFAILPGNNLMDFAAAIGIKAYVFSPTNSLKNWTLPSTMNYVFSRNITIIASEDDSFAAPSTLVQKLVDLIALDFPASKTCFTNHRS